MNRLVEKIAPLVHRVLPLLEICLAPFTFLGALLFAFIRRAGIQRMPLTRRILFKVGVFPVVRHYYEPQFDCRGLRHPLSAERALPGIEWNLSEQLQILGEFHYADELARFPYEPTGELEYHYRNDFFCAGDSEYLYSMVRRLAPANVIEIGSGNSTLMVRNAIRKNAEDNPGYVCRHLCIEPYEMPWLEKAGVEVLRHRVEEVDPSIFSTLGPGDILFVDSSHMIRPQGDVLAIYLQILPTLRPGVVVHVHDILTPRDYFEQWLVDEVKFWNEQYLLEAFLTLNREFRIIGAVNYLKQHHFDLLSAKCPVLGSHPECEPGSFWLVRN
ncbi:class I SAM-dependent methyltransferase [Geomonas subterranea]|uniref:Class I SAM-dependent methyltransferase n=1 Tax=Geomonas subterranea TaxID=2847989 RepID=A0ABX8LNY4_9BACT|nr:class I SAM-dependent methyltransferase [Geomonas subterranea]QXE92339.1 class I SAM-dependent methyltransferase [Geomonas subterranea]QXM09562.1 class I SAM-dependent methyltransferase [Geomonas subterranea]